MIDIRDALLGVGYRGVVKSVLFRFDPEKVHNAISGFGVALGRSRMTRALTRAAFGYEHPILRTTVAGIAVNNPIGLSAGFDKEGRLVDIIPAVGFGFMEIGSITGTPCPGNPKPRLWRLPRSQGLAVYFGLSSSGAEAVAARLRTRRPAFPWAVNIVKANRPEFDGVTAAIADYVRAGQALNGLGAMRVINISCPNTSGGEPFQDPGNLDRLLIALDPLLAAYPVFIKLPVDEPLDRISELVAASRRHRVTGFICTNLTKRRDHPTIRDAAVPPAGGLSGKIIEARANAVLAHVYRLTHGTMPLIGVGGVFSAEDAYRKIRLGASLVSLVTGLIYRGPTVVSEIKRGLVRLLRRDGLTSVAAAVGRDA